MMVRIVYAYVIVVLSVVNHCFGQDTIATEEVLIENGNIKLPGTLTYHTTTEKQPLVIFVHGSGNIDRNGNQGPIVNPNYIKLLNDSLVARNIAFYRYDKRSATSENLQYVIKDIKLDYYVDDLNLAIDQFKNDDRFSSITLIGHSQGSLVAMLANHTHIDKYISLAGAGDSIENLLVKQIGTQNGEATANILKSHLKELSETGTIKTIDPSLMMYVNKPVQPFLLSWMKYDPLEEIKKVKIPILILNGDKDAQVFIENAKALHQANPKSELVILKNMNHVLKTIEDESDTMKSLTTPDFPLSSDLSSTIEAFIKQ